MSATDCYCRGAGTCTNCGRHACTDCTCDDIDQRKETGQ